MPKDSNSRVTMDTSELCNAIDELFTSSETQSFGEYELLSLLADQSALRIVEPDPDLQLFKRHFVLKNALYQLQQCWLEEKRGYLDISPLSITLRSLQDVSHDSLPSAHANVDMYLQEYYGDWQNFHEMQPGGVKALLKQFWAMYASYDNQEDALAVLQLSRDATMDEVKRSYQALAAEHHPDKGGSGERFHEIRQAYEHLKKVKR